jgi:hypothetical protein
MAPEPFFNEGMHVIKQVLTEKEFDELNKALAINKMNANPEGQNYNP